MITDKPEDLERRAKEMEEEAREALRTTRAAQPRFEAECKLRAADRLRERAAQLRKRRTDGVRFG
jgi:hypothetical protein